MSERLHSIEYGTNAEVTAKMLRVLFPETETILDMTYGSGKFWGDAPPWRVTGVDLNPERARDVCADFTRLPFVDGAFDVAMNTVVAKELRLAGSFRFHPEFKAERGAHGQGANCTGCNRFTTIRSDCNRPSNDRLPITPTD